MYFITPIWDVSSKRNELLSTRNYFSQLQSITGVAGLGVGVYSWSCQVIRNPSYCKVHRSYQIFETLTADICHTLNVSMASIYYYLVFSQSASYILFQFQVHQYPVLNKYNQNLFKISSPIMNQRKRQISNDTEKTSPDLNGFWV